MHTTSDGRPGCCGQPGPSGQGGPDVLERPRYFPRQLITADELTLEADYFRDRMRRHNRFLHGWGVVCGALVCAVAGRAWQVRVEPGYVLGPYGDEIVIERAQDVPLRSGDPADPWCSETYERDHDGPLYVAVRYDERRIRPVHAQPSGCDCDQLACEYSRFRDGFAFGILDACPASHEAPSPADAAGNPACPGAPDSPWVVLARVTVDEDGMVDTIDNCACRRIVPSTGDSWHPCGEPQPARAGRPEPVSGADGPAPGAEEGAPETPKRGRATTRAQQRRT
ncbi:hypothetical protein [Nonomuraea sp. NPDC002799]